MKFEIKHRYSNEVLFSVEIGSLRLAVEAAVKSGANLGGANLHNADLAGANLGGADLHNANLRGADLHNANLRGADLHNANLRGASLHGANLTDADLTGANLDGAKFYRVPNLHQEILKAIDGGGTLDMGSWHTCETTHCRAGWAVHLAGKSGQLLESMYGTPAAAALIHIASCPWMERVPDFYASNEDALADIQACAEREKTGSGEGV